MKTALLAAAAAAAFGIALPAFAQNIAIVNGKPVPKSRVDMLAAQIAKSGRAVSPEMQGQLKDEVIAREIFLQEAQKRGLDASDDFKTQMELARQTILIRELFSDYQKKNPVTDAEVKAEYDKFVAANGGKEYKARHILVEKEDEAKKIIADLKGRGLPILLAGMEAPRNLGKDYVEQFRAMYADLAQRYDLILYPFFLDGVALDDGYLLDDGLHPNAAGVERIVEGILPKVEELLAKTKPQT